MNNYTKPTRSIVMSSNDDFKMLCPKDFNHVKETLCPRDFKRAKKTLMQSYFKPGENYIIESESENGVESWEGTFVNYGAYYADDSSYDEVWPDFLTPENVRKSACFETDTFYSA
jgi:hypothetical protein